MKKASLAVFGMVLLLSLAALPALGYVEEGDKWETWNFQATVSPEGANYLGVPAGKPFKLSQVKAPYVLLEVFATACSHCYAHAPVMNSLFNKINKDPETAEIKMIGLASAGIVRTMCTAWKKQSKFLLRW